MDEKTQGPAVDRRSFLGKVGAGAAGAAVAATLPRSAHAHVSKAEAKPRYGMLIDLRRCIGCHACSVACKSEFDVPLGSWRSWVEYIEKGKYPNVKRSFLPRLCNHCTHPPCVDVCPANATWKREEDGIVIVDYERCIGCGYCVQACPYGARFMNPTTGTADKCDFCLHRVSQGLVPSCVNTCMAEARVFGDLNDPESEISKKIATNPVTVLRPEMGTEPNVYYIEADQTDPNIPGERDEYIRVETHRREEERV